MSTPVIANLEKMVGTPRDGELLRYALGNEYLKSGDFATAARHLQAAVAFNPRHSAAWKLLGKALDGAGDRPAALEAYRQGIEMAEQRGDIQAVKEMRVFARRLEKTINSAA